MECINFLSAQARLMDAIAQGQVSSHVVAYVLGKILGGVACQLEEVSVHEWLVEESDGQELASVVSKMIHRITDGYMSYADATSIIESVHTHIDCARERLMQTSLFELDGIDSLARHFGNKTGILTIGEFLGKSSTELTSFCHSEAITFSTLAHIQEVVRRLPLTAV